MCNNLDILRRDHFHRYAVMPGGTDGGQLCFSQGAQPQWPRHWENREQHFSKRWRSGIHRLPTVQTRDHWVRGGSVDSTIFFSCPRFCTDLYADSLFEQLWQLSPSLQSITCMLSVPVSSSTSTRLRQISLRFSSLTSLQGNRREHRGAGSCSRRQQKTNDLPIRLSQTLRHSRGVDIHRRADVRMAKQFLLHLYVCAILIERNAAWQRRHGYLQIRSDGEKDLQILEFGHFRLRLRCIQFDRRDEQCGCGCCTLHANP